MMASSGQPDVATSGGPNAATSVQVSHGEGRGKLGAAPTRSGADELGSGRSGSGQIGRWSERAAVSSARAGQRCELCCD
jgi:hypothetical protein